MLDIQNLTMKYGQSQILNTMSLNAKAGEVTAVMGTNGVGKTSLLKAISGRHPYADGTITLDGKLINHLSPFDAAKAGIAYVPQGREVFPLMTVVENLESGFACLGRSDHKVPDHIYDLFPVLHDMAGRRGGDLSGGQQQQLAIARALITRPKVLLLDEPTEGIQPSTIKSIAASLNELRIERKFALLVSEQMLSFAYEIADRFIVLDKGRIIFETSAQDVEPKRLQELLSI